MSLEYTIDIQLTELGFPNIFEAVEAPVKETPEPAAPEPPELSPEAPSPSPPRTDTPAGRQLVSKRGDKDGAVNANEIRIFNGTKTRNGQEEKESEDTERESEETDDSGVSDREEEEDEEDGFEPGMEASGSGEHRCGVCELILPSVFQLQDHMNMHTGERPYCCAECGKRFCQMVNYHSHLRTHSHSHVKPHETMPENCCRICLKGFKSQASLKDHQNVAHLEKEFYECDLCKRIFTDRQKCEEHIEWHKTMLGAHVCPKCGRHFLLAKSLSRHQQRNCQEPNYRCADCSVIFHSKNSLLQHSFTHLGLPPYTCVQCRRHFRLARHYNKHKCEPDRIHCVACLGVFLSQDDFQRHKEETGCWGHQGSKGDEIRCMECGESFASAEELKKHAGAHQRILTCFECGKGFRSSLLLMSHMGGHAGQRPCLCQKCGLGFPHQQVYESHLKNCGNITFLTMAPKKPRKDAHQGTPVSVKVTSNVTKSPTQAILKIPITEPPQYPTHKLPIPRYTPAKPTNGLSPSVSRTVSIPAGVLNNSLVPVKDSADGVWKLSLDKDPPPGVKLVVFVPANSHLASGLSGPPPNPETPPTSVCQPQHLGMVLPPAPRPNLGMEPYEATVNPVRSLPQGAYKPSDVPLDLVKKTVGNKQEPSDILPLDLSNSTSARTFHAPHVASSTLSIKSEAVDPEFSEEPLRSAHGLVQVKKEPQPPGPDGEEQDSDMWASNKLLAWKMEIETVTGADGTANGRDPASPSDVVKPVDLKLEGDLKGGEGEIGREERDRVLEKEPDSNGVEVRSDEGDGVLEKEEDSNGVEVGSDERDGVLEKEQDSNGVKVGTEGSDGVSEKEQDSNGVEVGSDGSDRVLEKEHDLNGSEVGSEGRDSVLEKESECIDSGLDPVAQQNLHLKRASDTFPIGPSPDITTQSSSPSSPPTTPQSKRVKLV